MTSRDGLHATTEVKYIIVSYPYITQSTLDSYIEIMWSDNSGSGLGRHYTENYGVGLDDPDKQEVISQQRLRSKMIGLLIKNSLTTDVKRKLRDSRSA